MNSRHMLKNSLKQKMLSHLLDRGILMDPYTIEFVTEKTSGLL